MNSNWTTDENKKEAGLRFDKGKTRFDLIPSTPLSQVAKVFDIEKRQIENMHCISSQAFKDVADVFTFGCQKYDEHNWRKGMSWSRCFAPLQRHLNKFWLKYPNDEDSNLPHLAHAIWNCLALMEYDFEGIGTDDRIQSIEDKPPIFEHSIPVDFKAIYGEYPYSHCYNQALSFSWNFWSIPTYDTICHPLAYTAAYCFILMDYEYRNIGYDDRQCPKMYEYELNKKYEIISV